MIDDMLTIRPQPRFFMPGSAMRVRSKGAVTFTAIA